MNIQSSFRCWKRETMPYKKLWPLLKLISRSSRKLWKACNLSSLLKRWRRRMEQERVRGFRLPQVRRETSRLKARKFWKMMESKCLIWTLCNKTLRMTFASRCLLQVSFPRDLPLLAEIHVLNLSSSPTLKSPVSSMKLSKPRKTRMSAQNRSNNWWTQSKWRKQSKISMKNFWSKMKFWQSLKTSRKRATTR